MTLNASSSLFPVECGTVKSDGWFAGTVPRCSPILKFRFGSDGAGSEQDSHCNEEQGMAQHARSVIQPPRKRLAANLGAAAECDCRILAGQAGAGSAMADQASA